MTRPSTGPALVNPKTYKYFAKGREFDYLPDLKADDYPLTIRFVRFQLEDGSILTLATSLSEEDFPPCLLAELYHLRREIETDQDWQGTICISQGLRMKKWSHFGDSR